jgi:glyoxylase-like metal-dependent hydrolase (beta-lactamase superfamily II)
MNDSPAALHGLHIFERGWLSSNNVLVQGDGGGATLIDSSHTVHAAQTVALVRHALAQPDEHSEATPWLLQVVNTHLHSDHCGGNATLHREFGARVLVPESSFRAVQAWDLDELSFRHTGQRCERFEAQGSIAPGQTLFLGARAWQVLAAPGHDPDSVLLFDADHGVLISADALWENGFGVVFPELVGEPGFDDVAAVLDLIDTLPVQWVIPGHGAPFQDVKGALQRARTRLQGMRAEPSRHARHAARVLLKYHLMEERTQALPALRAWAEGTPLFARTWQDAGQHEATTPAAWCEQIVQALASSGALKLIDGVVHDA